MTKLSISQAANELGVSRETVRRGLNRNGIKTGEPGQTYALREIFNAVSGDFRFERTRREKAAADKLELENTRERGELVNIPEMERLLWQTIYLPLRNELETLPERLAEIIAPGDAERVKKILRDAVEQMKANCREPQPKTENEK